MLSVQLPGNLLSLTHPMLTVHFLIFGTLLIKLLKPSFLRKLFTLLKEINLVLITNLKL